MLNKRFTLSESSQPEQRDDAKLHIATRKQANKQAISIFFCFLLPVVALISLFRLCNLLLAPGRHVNGMCKLARVHVGFPNFDALVGFSRHQSRARAIKTSGKDTIFCFERSRLDDRLRRLEFDLQLIASR